MKVAFSWLASYVISSGVDQTGLGWWSWIQVGTGEHWTQIVLAYQPCRLSGCRLIGQNGLMKGRGMVVAQHKCYFQKNGNFNKPREILYKVAWGAPILQDAQLHGDFGFLANMDLVDQVLRGSYVYPKNMDTHTKLMLQEAQHIFHRLLLKKEVVDFVSTTDFQSYW
jgi:hypothetical protein